MPTDKPKPGAWIVWRPLQRGNGQIPEWRPGYVVYTEDGHIRMGRYIGDTEGAIVVDPEEIEWTERK